MKAHSPRPHPAPKSKTALRRGHLTPGPTLGRKTQAPRIGTPTTLAEQAMLFEAAARIEPPELNHTED
jgi:hypothetical protein